MRHRPRARVFAPALALALALPVASYAHVSTVHASGVRATLHDDTPPADQTDTPSPDQTDTPAPEDTPEPTDTTTPDAVALDSVNPETVVAKSGASITIQCTSGCDDNASVSVGDADISDNDVTYNAAKNTETFTLPRTVDPDTYDVTVTEPDGRSDTLSSALTVEQRLVVSARLSRNTVRRAKSFTAIVRTDADSDNWDATVRTAQGRALPNVQVTRDDVNDGVYKLTIQTNKHVPLGAKTLVISATLGSQHMVVSYPFSIAK